MPHAALRQAFPTTPDRSRVYPATEAENALARLAAALDDDDGFVVVTGPAGTGKTLLVHRLLGRVGPDRRTVLLTNSHFAGRAALLQAVLFDLGLPHDGPDEQALRLTLTAHLLDKLAGRAGVVLVVDEAHHLDADLLEELRLLGNLEAGGRHAVQVVLVGLPGLTDRLRTPALAALAQRVGTHVHVGPLGPAEAVDYVAHLLRTAGPDALEVVPDEAREAAAGVAGGVPRRLNQVVREALRVADEVGADVVDVEMVQEAAVRLGLDLDAPPAWDGPESEAPLAA